MEDGEVTACGAGAGVVCGVRGEIYRNNLSRGDLASLASGQQGLGIEPAWAASGGQLLTLLGAAAPAGEEEAPGLLSALIHDPQGWCGALCVIGDPLPDRLQEGDGGEQAPTWKSSNRVRPVLFRSADGGQTHESEA